MQLHLDAGPERKLTQDLSTLTSSLGNLGGGSLPTNFNVGDVASTVTNLAGSGNGGNLASTASSFLGGASGSGGTSMISNLAGSLGELLTCKASSTVATIGNYNDHSISDVHMSNALVNNTSVLHSAVCA